MLRNWLILLITVVVLISSGGGWLYYSANKERHVDSTLQALQTVKYVANVKNKYDVIVVGTDPEGITAAVSAARNGLKTLLVDGRDRKILGGLMTLGWLNSIDMNYDYTKPSLLPGKPNYFNQGLFKEWYDMIEGNSFDTRTAANAFYKMVKGEKNIDLLLETKSITPLLKDTADKQLIEGVKITKKDGTIQSVFAASIIDATQDADIAFAAGVPFTIGREDLGDKKAQMAVTLVFKIKNVTPSVWKGIEKRLNGDSSDGTGADATSAWGYSEMRAYVPLNPKLAKMRGLNIGRQNDNTILLNALLLYEVDPLNADSQKKARGIAMQELPRVVDYMKKNLPEFANVEFDGVAPELYVRETRHMIGEYRLTIVDLLENKDQWDRIAFGAYESDIQPKDPQEGGNVVLDPQKYAVPFRSIVPINIDGLLVVGRSASYDTLAHGSARVIPNGMAVGESAGVAAKIAKENKVSFRELSKSKSQMAQMQSIMNKQGMDIKPYQLKKESYMNHPYYDGLKVAVYLHFLDGSYGNVAFDLDGMSNVQRVVYHMNNIQKKYPDMFKGIPGAAIANKTEAEKKLPLTLDQLSFTITKTMNLPTELNEAQAELVNQKLISQKTIDAIKNKAALTNGEVYMVLRDLLAARVDLHLE